MSNNDPMTDALAVERIDRWLADWHAAAALHPDVCEAINHATARLRAGLTTAEAATPMTHAEEGDEAARRG